MSDRAVLLAECAEVCTSGCHADDCEHHGHIPDTPMTDDTARSDALRAETPQEARNRLRAEVAEVMADEEYDAGFIDEVRALLGPDEPNVPALAAPAADPRDGLPCCGHPAEEHLWSGGCCVCPCPAARPTSAAAQPEPSEPGLREALEAAGFEPPDNVCKACGHSGGDHDLGNWCLLCPRPEWDQTAKSPTGAKIDAGWCYFSSMDREERWTYGVAALRPSAGLRAALDVLHADARDPKRASAWRYGVRHTLSVIERALSKQQETPR